MLYKFAVRTSNYFINSIKKYSHTKKLAFKKKVAVYDIFIYIEFRLQIFY